VTVIALLTGEVGPGSEISGAGEVQGSHVAAASCEGRDWSFLYTRTDQSQAVGTS